MQRTRIQSLVWEDFHMRQDYWSPRVLEPVLCSKRSHCNKKPEYCNEVAPAHSKEEPAQQLPQIVFKND